AATSLLNRRPLGPRVRVTRRERQADAPDLGRVRGTSRNVAEWEFARRPRIESLSDPTKGSSYWDGWASQGSPGSWGLGSRWASSGWLVTHTPPPDPLRFLRPIRPGLDPGQPHPAPGELFDVWARGGKTIGRSILGAVRNRPRSSLVCSIASPS